MRTHKRQSNRLKRKYPFFHQLDAMDCGPACLQMVTAYYHYRPYALPYLRELCYASRNGVSLEGISNAAEAIGFCTQAVHTTFEHFQRNMIFPCIVFWRQRHFVVVYGIESRYSLRGRCDSVVIGDPAFGILRYTSQEFLDGWLCEQDDKEAGIALMLVPCGERLKEGTEEHYRHFNFNYFGKYIHPYTRPLVWVGGCMLLNLVIQMVFPFLTQALVDVGIKESSLNYILLILGAQLTLSLSMLAFELIQSWILLHVVTKVNIAMIADFITKMLKLPINFFDSKNTGDIMQRIDDNRRVENFFTASSVRTFFSLFSFLVFSAILGYYNPFMLLVFLVGHAFYIVWTTLFLKVRRRLDFKRFDEEAKNQSNIVQIIQGAEEIKLNGCEKKMRQGWESIQRELFNISVKGMKVEQVQNIGSFFISNIVNTGLLAYAAWLVVNDNITLGMMMSLTYIIGQLNAPIQNFASFIYDWQKAHISLERLAEVHLKKDEDELNIHRQTVWNPQGDICLRNVMFSYYGTVHSAVLHNLNLTIEYGKITAIVGESGSGKTTLLKLLLGYYAPQQGVLQIGNLNFSDINTCNWRSRCAAVLQNGFIFSASIAENIGIKDEVMNMERIREAARLANIDDFINSLPLGYQTQIGPDGGGLSQGQKQRILIARAVYRNPEYLFFDEATNALDASNEREVMQHMNCFFQGRTVVVIAHRLSTVCNADKIIVLKKGHIVEEGKHDELIRLKGFYYNLVKDQLVLG